MTTLTTTNQAPANDGETTTLSVARDSRAGAGELVTPGFGTIKGFEMMLRGAKLLSASTLVPAAYRAWDDKKNVENPSALPNAVVALNMANRMGADPLMVMQNLYIVEGRPAWSSQWIIAAINGCGKFSPLRFDIVDLGEKTVSYSVTEWINREKTTKTLTATVRNLECVAWAIEKETGERITGPRVSVEMAVKEGWYGKNGSKWQTMPEVMLRYRAASFFGKIYAPELLMGLQTVEEAQDIIDVTPTDTIKKESVTVESMRSAAQTKPASEQPAQTPEPIQPHAQPAPTLEYDKIAASLNGANDLDVLDVAADLISAVESDDDKAALRQLYSTRRAELEQQQRQQQPAQRQRRSGSFN